MAQTSDQQNQHAQEALQDEDRQQAEDRSPAPDHAEDGAFFPSPYSLSQYTAPTTDFDGFATDEAYAGDRWKVLVIATAERYMLMDNGTFFSTGNHPVETLLPLHHMAHAGYGIDIATIDGTPAKFEWWAYPSQDAAVAQAWEASRADFKAPRRLSDVIADGLEDYAAVFIPGGHGAMNALPFSAEVQEALDFFLAEDRLIVSLCHGPAAFRAAGLGRSSNPFAGFAITAFPDALDFGANLEIGYLPGPMPWKLGEALRAEGLTILNDDMTGQTTRDRNVLTGDSPLAANALGKEAAAALLERFGS
ncbi:protein deglycase HchA [Brevibacterium sp. 5221]|uniref:Protein deglycase HchA n=1 Tax=Brevibacterium rongguiense TaxID=2695267 RepID=A0A6N9H7C8_9MICO|nr:MULTISPECIES: glyoxalase III HchA [Brevibacterium]MYM19791.1 protein deglycase HchA [Brevibacterium rongguiense]WAL40405.1 protein deglycase HchA [Brevibacterium sp. BRM-1]